MQKYISIGLSLLATTIFAQSKGGRVATDISEVERCKMMEQKTFKSGWGGSLGASMGIESCRKQAVQHAEKIKANTIFVVDQNSSYSTSLTINFYDCSKKETKKADSSAEYIAVLPLEAKGISKEECDLLTDALVVSFQDAAKYQVMERSQINMVLKEQGFATSGACDSSDCSVQIGKLLTVNKIITGSIGKLGEVWIFNLKMIDVSTGAIIHSSREKRKGDISQLTAVFDEVAKQF
jgi:TolB-like protein